MKININGIEIGSQVQLTVTNCMGRVAKITQFFNGAGDIKTMVTVYTDKNWGFGVEADRTQVRDINELRVVEGSDVITLNSEWYDSWEASH